MATELFKTPKVDPKPLTRTQAIEYFASKEWDKLSDKDAALFQIRQKYMCMHYEKYLRGLKELLGREIPYSEMGQFEKFRTELKI